VSMREQIIVAGEQCQERGLCLERVLSSLVFEFLQLLSSQHLTPVLVEQQSGITPPLLPAICVSLLFLHLLISLVLTTALFPSLVSNSFFFSSWAVFGDHCCQQFVLSLC